MCADLEAAARVRASGVAVEPAIMIPLVGHREGARPPGDVVRRVARKVMAETGTRFRYLVAP